MGKSGKRKTKLNIWVYADLVVVLAILVVVLVGNDLETNKKARNASEISPTVIAVPTPSDTPTPSPTNTPIPTNTPTPSNTPTPTNTPTPSITPTDTPTPTPSESPTPTPTNTPTNTAVPDLSKPVVYGDYSNDERKARSWPEFKIQNHQQPDYSVADMLHFDEMDAHYVDKKASDDDKVICFTFYCGYELTTTGKVADILDILKKHNATAAFFVMRGFINQAPIDTLKRMVEEGHVVGNHSANHPNFGNASDKTIKDELAEVESLFKKKTGYEMDKYVSPPGSDYSMHAVHLLYDMGYRTFFNSIRVANDWNLNKDVQASHTVEYILNIFKEKHHNGAIVALHPVSQANINALDAVLTYLESEGYRIGSLREIQK